MRRIEVSELCYADDMVLIAKNENLEIYRKALEGINKALKGINMKISREKTKTMIMGRN